MTFSLIFVIFAISFKFSQCAVMIESPTIKQEVFSAAPNNTPVTRVYVFGKPVYIRQPFMVPQRNNEGDQLERLSKPFDKRKIRQSYIGAENAYNPKPSYAEEPVSSSVDDYVNQKPAYPLKQCYTESSGYMCCNKQLEKVMDKTVEELVAKQWKECNVHQLATMLQKNCEAEFGTDFETIGGIGDFASKVHFFSDLVCKMERHGRVMLAYATPNRHNYNNPYHS